MTIDRLKECHAIAMQLRKKESRDNRKLLEDAADAIECLITEGMISGMIATGNDRLPTYLINDFEYIVDALPATALWGQLAEECTELAQAALKIQRQTQGYNLPSAEPWTLAGNITEEIADVMLCIKLLGWEDEHARRLIQRGKLRRWAERLRKEAGDDGGDSENKG